MTSSAGEQQSGSNTKDLPLKSVIETPLTESLINEIFHQQGSDGSFPATEKFGQLFNASFEVVKQELKAKGLESSSEDEVYRLISTAAILFYILYHSQKTKFPVDIDAIKQFVSKARNELESFSMKDDPIMQTYIDKGELAVQFVIDTREKHLRLCQDFNLPQPTWESYVQHLMGLDNQ